MPKTRPADPNELTTSNIAKRFPDEEEPWELVERAFGQIAGKPLMYRDS